MNDVIGDASTLLDKNVSLGVYLDEQLARARTIEYAEDDDTSETDEFFETEHFETPIRPGTPRYELPDIPEGYVMDG